MATPPHYGPGPDPPQQYPGSRNTNPSSDEVVIYFQNYHNRPSSMAMPPQASLPPPPLHQPAAGKASCSRGPLNPFPLNFPLPPRPMASMNEHEAAAYFLAHMNETSNGQRDMSHEAGNHPRDMHTGIAAHQTASRDVSGESGVLRHIAAHQTGNRGVSDESNASRNINNETAVNRNNNTQNITVTSRELVQNQNQAAINSRNSVQNQNQTMVSSKSAQSHYNTSTSSRNSESNQNHPLSPGSSVSNQNIPLSPGPSVSNQNPPLGSGTSAVRHPENTGHSLPSQNRANSAVRQQQPTTTGDSSQNQSLSMSSPNSSGNQRDTPTISPDGEDDTQEDQERILPFDTREQDLMLPSDNRLNSSEDEDEEEQQAIIPAQLSAFNVELILSKQRRRMSPEEKIIFNRLKHPLKPPCKCKRKCFERINEERRKVVNFSFWGLNYVERAMFLLSHVKRNKTNRKTVRGLSRRRFSLNYTMLDEKNKLHTVCKIFFVATLGLVSDKCITQLFLKNPVGTLIPQGDLRGKHKPANRIDTTIVRRHIEAYCKQFPVPSKNKNLHIPPGITKMQMYNDFKARVKNYKCGPSRYAQVVKEMNVVFGRKKPPKQPKTSEPLPTQVGIGSIPNHDRQNQSNNFNRIGNFSIPGVQDSQSLMYPMQQSGTFPPHPQMPLWDQIDQQVHMFQNQFLESGAATSSSSSNNSSNNNPSNSSSNNPPSSSNSSKNHPGNSKNQGSTSSHGFGVTAPPPGLMPLPGFVLPPHLDISVPTAKGGCENCAACRLEKENAAVEAEEAAELEADSAEGSNDDDESQESSPSVSKPKPPVTSKKQLPRILTPQELQAILSLPQQPIPTQQGNPSQQAIPTQQSNPSQTGNPSQPGNPTQPSNPTQPAKKPKRIRPKSDEERIAIKRMKYPLLPPCKCPKKCGEKVNEDRRKVINFLFWGLQYQMRAMFLLNHIKQCFAKRHTVGPGESSRRKFSRSYVLPDDQDKLQSVCKIFFLHTLGFTSDSVVTKLLRKNPIGTVVPVAVDRRGKHAPKKKLDTKPIKEHIQSHMRKSKGKYRLPADINVRRMWKDFKFRNPDFKCAYESYRQIVKDIRGSKKSLQQQPSADIFIHPAAHPSAALANAAAARANIATTAAPVAATSNSAASAAAAAAAAAHSAVVMDMLRLIDA